jgi:uncharacterized protein (TIGR00369 family)
MRKLPRSKSCFVCGVANPAGLALQFHDDGTRVTARFRFRADHVGFAETVHGGLISTVLDEVMVWVCGVRTGQFAYCAELTVRFMQPVRPGEDVLVTAELVRNRRGRLFEARAELSDSAGRAHATATGKYLPIPATVVEGMLDDFVQDPRPVLAGGAGAI